MKEIKSNLSQKGQVTKKNLPSNFEFHTKGNFFGALEAYAMYQLSERIKLTLIIEKSS